jgi:putative transposase
VSPPGLQARISVIPGSENGLMRYRLYPDGSQAATMRGHCEHARFVWNLALEQWSCWRPGRRPTPSSAERMIHLEPHHVRRLNRRWAQVWVPKCGWVRFRWTRPVPGVVRSYRVTLDRAGRWHIAFAKKPEPIPGPGTGEVVGVDRGVINTVALSSGELISCPQPCLGRQRRLQRRLAARRKGSKRREQDRRRLARLKAREADRRKDWVEQTTTRVARQFDVIRIEDLRTCGYRERTNRESQARFCCRACGYVDHADVNAARNICRGTHGGSAGSHLDCQRRSITPAASSGCWR